MNLHEITLRNFRSYQNKKIELHPKLNLIIGPNGSGKTNLLEALYVVAQTKSYRARDDSLVRHGADSYTLLARSENIDYKISYQLKPKRQKLVKLNNTKTKPEEYIGSLPVVLFEPNSVLILAGAPLSRRNFMDGLLCGVDKQYFINLIQYRRVLKQRNALLRSKPRNLNSQIFAWDLRLAELGGYIYNKRLDFVSFLDTKASGLYKDISGKKAFIRSSYSSSCASEDYASSLLTVLQKHLQRDLIFGNTGDGIHRDDIEIEFNSSLVGAVASRGEIRTLTLVYKLIELAYIEQQSHTQPLILLDDVFSELDVVRREYLLHRLEAYQSVITTTDLHGINNIPKNSHAMINLGDNHARKRSPVSSKKSSKA